MKIDLQIHTNHSDGHETPEEIIELAKQGNVDFVAITDHDMVSGVSSAILKAQEKNITVIPAVEITTSYHGKPLHVLGYGIDINNRDLLVFLSEINKSRQDYFLSVIPRVNKNLIEDGKKIIDAEKYKNKEAKYYSIPGIALFLYEEKIVEGRNDGFTYFLDINDVVPIVEPKEVFAIIHKAQGRAFISHPFAPLISLKNITEDKVEQEKIIMEFKKNGLDGLECYQAGHSLEDVNFCLELSEKYNLLISAGSDWHGCLEKTGETIKKWLPYYLNKLGDLEVPEDRARQILKGLNILY